MLYDYQELETLRARARRTRLALIIAVLFFIAAASALLRIRSLIGIVALTVAFGAVLIFVLDLIIVPQARYLTLVQRIMTGGAYRKTQGRFDGVGEDRLVVDGVLSCGLFLRQGKHQRKLYLDVEKTLPPIELGQALSISLYDKFVVGIEAIDEITDAEVLGEEAEARRAADVPDGET